VVWHPRAGPSPDEDWKKYLIEMEASNIKRLTHSCHKRSEIAEWVEDNCPDPEASIAYAQKIPLNMLPLIREMKAMYFRAAPVTVLGVSDGTDVGLHATF
jgi:hypothetical protein